MNEKLIGKYRITGELTQGRWGTLYRGLLEDDQREVVLKSFPLSAFPKAVQVQLKARFRRELFVQRQLTHPNIISVLDGFLLDHTYYVVMEDFHAASLRDLLMRQGVPNLMQVVNYCKQVLTALDYAHKFSYLDESDFQRVGVVHGDVRLSNLLLDARGLVKLADFNVINRLLGAELTRLHPELGPYLAPEQLRGVEPDPRTDVYGLGVACYEMLTGRVPQAQQRRSSVRQSEGEAHGSGPERATKALLELRQDVPAPFAAVITRALRSSPYDRYATAADFLRALQGCEAELEALTVNSTSEREPVAKAAVASHSNGSANNLRESGRLVMPKAASGDAPEKTSEKPSEKTMERFWAASAAARQEWQPQLLQTLPADDPRPTRFRLADGQGDEARTSLATVSTRNLPTHNQPPKASAPGPRASLFPASTFQSGLPREFSLDVPLPPRQRGEWWLVPAMMASILVGVFAGAYFFSSPRTTEGLAANPATSKRGSSTTEPTSTDDLTPAPPATAAIASGNITASASAPVATIAGTTTPTAAVVKPAGNWRKPIAANKPRPVKALSGAGAGLAAPLTVPVISTNGSAGAIKAAPRTPATTAPTGAPAEITAPMTKGPMTKGKKGNPAPRAVTNPAATGTRRSAIAKPSPQRPRNVISRPAITVAPPSSTN